MPQKACQGGSKEAIKADKDRLELGWVVMGPCETSEIRDLWPFESQSSLMLYASDDEADLSRNCNVGGGETSGATSLVKASKSTSVDDLVQRNCRCGRKVCFQQFSGQTKAITAKRTELASLDPQDRVS